MTVTFSNIHSLIETTLPKIEELRSEIGKVVVGQRHLIDRVLIAILGGGHLLLEGLPGLAKTLVVKSLSQALRCNFRRIQFTPDLLPADLIGTSIYNPREGSFSVKKGPIFTHILLADEINRAPPKVQSALLEVMEEKQATVSGTTFRLEEPFLLLATQNPIEMEGTYLLPEAQVDRFMLKVKVSYPSPEEERKILRGFGGAEKLESVQPVMMAAEIITLRSLVREVYVDEKITQYILDIVWATRTPKKFKVDIDGALGHGASPRAGIMLTQAARAHAFLAGRGFVTPHDVKSVIYEVLCHRLKLSYEAEAEGISAESIIHKLLSSLVVP